MEEQLKKLYESEKLFNPNIDETCLHDECTNRLKCWGNEDQIKAYGHSYNKIALPYIGKNYEDHKILTLGLNLRGFGGVNSIKGLVGDLEYHFNDGKKENYGTIFFHRVFVYFAILYSYSNRIEFERIVSNNYYQNDFKYLIEMLDKIAFIESIKCSPNWNNSEPTTNMKKICPDYILRKELEILKPDKIIVLGKENWQLIRNLGKVVKDDCHYDKVFYSRVDFGFKEIDIYGTLHPALRKGGKSFDVIRDFADLVYKKHLSI